LAGPQLFGGIECQEHAGVAQRFGAGRPIELGEIYNIACAGEGVGNDRLTRLAQFEGDDERWSAKLHAPQDYRDSAREAALNMFDWRSYRRHSHAPRRESGSRSNVLCAARGRCRKLAGPILFFVASFQPASSNGTPVVLSSGRAHNTYKH